MIRIRLPPVPPSLPAKISRPWSLYGQLVAEFVAAEVEGDEGLAGDVGAFVVRLADQVARLLHAHADPGLGELAVRRRLAGDLAFVIVDALDFLAPAGLDRTGVDDFAARAEGKPPEAVTR